MNKIDKDKLIEFLRKNKTSAYELPNSDGYDRFECVEYSTLVDFILSLSSSTEEKKVDVEKLANDIYTGWYSDYETGQNRTHFIKGYNQALQSNPPLAEKKQLFCRCEFDAVIDKNGQCKMCGFSSKLNIGEDETLAIKGNFLKPEDKERADKIFETLRTNLDTPQPLTIEQAKDRAAKKFGYDNFDQYIHEPEGDTRVINEAMELYSSKFSNEAESLNVENGKLKQTIKRLQPRRLVDED